MADDQSFAEAFEGLRVAELEAGLIDRERHRAEAQAQLEQARRERDSALVERDQARAERDGALGALAGVQASLDAVLASPSWRVTSGLRRAKAIVQRTSSGDPS